MSAPDDEIMRDGIVRFAWAITQQQLGGFVLGGVLFSIVAAILAALITPPSNPTVAQRAAYGLVPLVAGVPVIVAVGFVWNLGRAPIVQRDSLRRFVRERLTPAIAFGEPRIQVHPRPGLGTIERYALIPVVTSGSASVDDVEVVLEACAPEVRGLRYERLTAFTDPRSQAGSISVPPGGRADFAIAFQDYFDGTQPTKWQFRYANGDLNPDMGLGRHKLTLTAHGRDVPEIREDFAVQFDEDQLVSLVRLAKYQGELRPGEPE
jgi:hypothetical protein